jgi:hypothetical protein
VVAPQGRGELLEPRSFQYIPSVNATITPRVGYGLMSFDALNYYTTQVPEAALCRRLIIQEMCTFVPQIVGPDGTVVQKARAIPSYRKDGTLEKVSFTGTNELEQLPELAWMTTRPDRFNAWPVWLSRFLYNTIVFDGSNYFRIRDDNHKTIGMRILDASTLFMVIDNRGEQPMPPAPAFSQIIYGTPYAWLNTLQLWYRPRQLRVNAPYGITAIEDSLRPLTLLDNLWQYEISEYTEGTMPESYLEMPAGWTPEQCLAYEQMMNRRMGGNAVERRRVKVVPQGVKVLDTKKSPWPTEARQAAFELVALNHGIHPSELGKAPGQGLGGKGFQEKGEDAHARMGISPIRTFMESAFNDVLQENGYSEYSFQLGTVPDGINPEKEEQKWAVRWTNKGITRNEYLAGVNMEQRKPNDPSGDAYWSQTATSEGVDAEPAPVPAALAAPGQPGQPVQQKPAQLKPGQGGPADKDTEPAEDQAAVPQDDAGKLLKHCGVCPEDDRYYGARVARAERVSMGIGANGAEIVSIQAGELTPIAALWKPAGSERDDLVEFIGGAMYLREEAAYLVDRAGDFNLVPVAYVTTVDEEPGAIVYYSMGNGDRLDAAVYKPYWLELAAVFDYISGQRDRRMHNWLTHPDDRERPLLIDNGMSFPTRPMNVNSAFVNAWGGSLLGAETVDRLKKLAGDVVWGDVAELVGDAACKLALERLGKAIESERLV